MQRGKRWLSLFMALVFCLSLMPVSVFAEESDAPVAVEDTVPYEAAQADTPEEVSDPAPAQEEEALVSEEETPSGTAAEEPAADGEAPDPVPGGGGGTPNTGDDTQPPDIHAEYYDNYHEVAPGNSVTLTVEVESCTGMPAFAWFEHRLDGSDSDTVLVEGADGPSYTVESPDYRYEYTCRVTDDFGRSSDVTFTVAVSNWVELDPVDAEWKNSGWVVYLGEDGAVMAVEPYGDDVEGVTFQWSKRALLLDEFGEPVLDEWGDYIYYFAPIEGETGKEFLAVDAAVGDVYQCVATDRYGNTREINFTVAEDTELTVTVTTPGAEPAGDIWWHIFAEPNAEVTLSVDASVKEGYTLSYAWYDDDGNEIEGETGSTLTVTADARKTYRCLVSDSAGNEQTIYLEMMVSNHLSIMTAYGTVFYANADGEATVTLDVSSDYWPLTYTWFTYAAITDGPAPMTQVGTTNDPAYTFTGVTAPFNVQVRVTDPYGNTAYWSGTVSIDTHFSAQAEKDWFRVQLGEEVTLRVIAASDNPLTYQWYARLDTVDAPGEEQLLEGEESGTLTVTVQQQGGYICRVTDGVNSARIWFSVSIENNLRAWIEDLEGREVYTLTVPYGESATLTANYSANDTSGITFQWYRMIETGPNSYSRERIDGATEQAYTVDSVTGASRYTCEVRDRFGSGSQSGVVLVGVDTGLWIEPKDYNYEVTVAAGEGATLEVVAGANEGESYSLQWYKRVRVDNEYGDWYYGQQLLENETGASLVLENVTEATEYFCRATDSYGLDVSCSIRVIVDNGLRVTPVGGRNTFYADENGEAAVAVDVTANIKDGLTVRWYSVVEENGWTTREEMDESLWSVETLADGALRTTVPVTGVDRAMRFDLEVADAFGNNWNQRFTVTVDNALTASAAEREVYIPAGETGTLRVIASAKDMEGLTYAWYRPGNYGPETPVDNDGDDPAALTVTGTEGSAEYYCRVADKYGTELTVWFRVTNEKPWDYDHRFATAEELNAVIEAFQNSDACYASYTSGADFVFDTIEIPENFSVQFNNSESGAVIPAGVTVRVNGDLALNDLRIEEGGQLIVGPSGWMNLQTLTDENPDGSGLVFEPDENGRSGHVNYNPNIRNTGEFDDALAFARANTNGTVSVFANVIGDVELNGDYDLPGNFSVNITSYWRDGYESTGSLTVNGVLRLSAELNGYNGAFTLNGTLVNNGYVTLHCRNYYPWDSYWDDPLAVTVGMEAAYEGDGRLTVYTGVSEADGEWYVNPVNEFLPDRLVDGLVVEQIKTVQPEYNNYEGGYIYRSGANIFRSAEELYAILENLDPAEYRSVTYLPEDDATEFEFTVPDGYEGEEPFAVTLPENLYIDFSRADELVVDGGVRLVVDRYFEYYGGLRVWGEIELNTQLQVGTLEVESNFMGFTFGRDGRLEVRRDVYGEELYDWWPGWTDLDDAIDYAGVLETGFGDSVSNYLSGALDIDPEEARETWEYQDKLNELHSHIAVIIGLHGSFELDLPADYETYPVELPPIAELHLWGYWDEETHSYSSSDLTVDEGVCLHNTRFIAVNDGVLFVLGELKNDGNIEVDVGSGGAVDFMDVGTCSGNGEIDLMPYGMAIGELEPDSDEYMLAVLRFGIRGVGDMELGVTAPDSGFLYGRLDRENGYYVRMIDLSHTFATAEDLYDLLRDNTDGDHRAYYIGEADEFVFTDFVEGEETYYPLNDWEIDFGGVRKITIDEGARVRITRYTELDADLAVHGELELHAELRANGDVAFDSYDNFRFVEEGEHSALVITKRVETGYPFEDAVGWADAWNQRLSALAMAADADDAWTRENGEVRGRFEARIGVVGRTELTTAGAYVLGDFVHVHIWNNEDGTDNSSALTIGEGVTLTVRSQLGVWSGGDGGDIVVRGTLVLDGGQLDLEDNGHLLLEGGTLRNDGWLNLRLFRSENGAAAPRGNYADLSDGTYEGTGAICLRDIPRTSDGELLPLDNAVGTLLRGFNYAEHGLIGYQDGDEYRLEPLGGNLFQTYDQLIAIIDAGLPAGEEYIRAEYVPGAEAFSFPEGSRTEIPAWLSVDFGRSEDAVSLGANAVVEVQAGDRSTAELNAPCLDLADGAKLVVSGMVNVDIEQYAEAPLTANHMEFPQNDRGYVCYNWTVSEEDWKNVPGFAGVLYDDYDEQNLLDHVGLHLRITCAVEVNNALVLPDGVGVEIARDWYDNQEHIGSLTVAEGAHMSVPSLDVNSGSLIVNGTLAVHDLTVRCGGDPVVVFGENSALECTGRIRVEGEGRIAPAPMELFPSGMDFDNYAIFLFNEEVGFDDGYEMRWSPVVSDMAALQAAIDEYLYNGGQNEANCREDFVFEPFEKDGETVTELVIPEDFHVHIPGDALIDGGITVIVRRDGDLNVDGQLVLDEGSVLAVEGSVSARGILIDGELRFEQNGGLWIERDVADFDELGAALAEADEMEAAGETYDHWCLGINVNGSFSLPENATIRVGNRADLRVQNESVLTVPAGATLLVDRYLGVNSGTLDVYGTLQNDSRIELFLSGGVLKMEEGSTYRGYGQLALCQWNEVPAPEDCVENQLLGLDLENGFALEMSDDWQRTYRFVGLPNFFTTVEQLAAIIEDKADAPDDLRWAEYDGADPFVFAPFEKDGETVTELVIPDGFYVGIPGGEVSGEAEIAGGMTVALGDDAELYIGTALTLKEGAALDVDGRVFTYAFSENGDLRFGDHGNLWLETNVNSLDELDAAVKQADALENDEARRDHWFIGINIRSSIDLPEDRDVRFGYRADVRVRRDATLTVPAGRTLTLDGEFAALGTLDVCGTVQNNDRFEIYLRDGGMLILEDGATYRGYGQLALCELDDLDGLYEKYNVGSFEDLVAARLPGVDLDAFDHDWGDGWQENYRLRGLSNYFTTMEELAAIIEDKKDAPDDYRWAQCNGNFVFEPFEKDGETVTELVIPDGFQVIIHNDGAPVEIREGMTVTVARDARLDTYDMKLAGGALSIFGSVNVYGEFDESGGLPVFEDENEGGLWLERGVRSPEELNGCLGQAEYMESQGEKYDHWCIGINVAEDVELAEDTRVGHCADLRVRDGKTLTVPEGVTLTVDRYLGLDGTLAVEGTLQNNGRIEVFFRNDGKLSMAEGSAYKGYGDLAVCELNDLNDEERDSVAAAYLDGLELDAFAISYEDEWQRQYSLETLSNEFANTDELVAIIVDRVENNAPDYLWNAEYVGEAKEFVLTENILIPEGFAVYFNGADVTVPEDVALIVLGYLTSEGGTLTVDEGGELTVVECVEIYDFVNNGSATFEDGARLNYLRDAVDQASLRDIMAFADEPHESYEHIEAFIRTDIELTSDLVIPGNATIDVMYVLEPGQDDDPSHKLTVPKDKTLTVNGEVFLVGGDLVVGGSLVNDGNITVIYAAGGDDHRRFDSQMILDGGSYAGRGILELRGAQAAGGVDKLLVGFDDVDLVLNSYEPDNDIVRYELFDPDFHFRTLEQLMALIKNGAEFAIYAGNDDPFELTDITIPDGMAVDFGGNVEVTGNVTVDGSLYVNDLTVAEEATLTVNGRTYHGGELTVSGKLAFPEDGEAHMLQYVLAEDEEELRAAVAEANKLDPAGPYGFNIQFNGFAVLEEDLDCGPRALIQFIGDDALMFVTKDVSFSFEELAIFNGGIICVLGGTLENNGSLLIVSGGVDFGGTFDDGVEGEGDAGTFVNNGETLLLANTFESGIRFSEHSVYRGSGVISVVSGEYELSDVLPGLDLTGLIVEQVPDEEITTWLVSAPYDEFTDSDQLRAILSELAADEADPRWADGIRYAGPEVFTFTGETTLPEGLAIDFSAAKKLVLPEDALLENFVFLEADSMEIYGTLFNNTTIETKELSGGRYILNYGGGEFRILLPAARSLTEVQAAADLARSYEKTGADVTVVQRLLAPVALTESFTIPEKLLLRVGYDDENDVGGGITAASGRTLTVDGRLEIFDGCTVAVSGSLVNNGEILAYSDGTLALDGGDYTGGGALLVCEEEQTPGHVTGIDLTDGFISATESYEGPGGSFDVTAYRRRLITENGMPTVIYDENVSGDGEYSAILSEQEEDGVTVTTEVKITEETADPAEEQAILDFAEQEAGKEFEFLQLLEILVVQTTDGGDGEPETELITETEAPIRFRIVLDEPITGNVYVVRSHENPETHAIERMLIPVQRDGNTLIIRSDRFSTFAILCDGASLDTTFDLGDVNGDHRIDTADLLRLLKSMTLEPGTVRTYGITDFNSDGNKNSMDLYLLLRYVSGESEYII